jgi:hypothetical protein
LVQNHYSPNPHCFGPLQEFFALVLKNYKQMVSAVLLLEGFKPSELFSTRKKITALTVLTHHIRCTVKCIKLYLGITKWLKMEDLLRADQRISKSM